jgi:(4S)-4-hydroxy-5-phosphonooxypentane-2,3-dione isomerase
MIVNIINVYVKKDNIEDFIKATKANHIEAVKEKGNLRFDLLQSETDPKQFYLYEAYETKETAAAHKDTPHYLKWRDAVAPMMEKPRQGMPCKVICPEKWK